MTEELDTDGDILAERLDAGDDVAEKSDFKFRSDEEIALDPKSLGYIPLRVVNRTFQTTHDTSILLKAIGGKDSILKMTDIFYKKAFRDSILTKFIVDKNDPHFSRLGNWIVEKMGGEGNIWSAERKERAKCPVSRILSNGEAHVVHDRSSAHYAAWFSPLRPKIEQGEHFQLHESRVWMRLMFLSAREASLFQLCPSFETWFIRFIAHFVRVYEGTAPFFARESARWSLDEANVAAYLANSCSMGSEVIGSGRGVRKEIAFSQIPFEEATDYIWPYEQAD